MPKFSEQIIKIRSMTLDTNVISDLLALVSVYGPKLRAKEGIPSSELPYYERCVASKHAMFIMLDFDVERVGLKTVYRELLQRPPLHMIYRGMFPYEAKIERRAKSLAEKYASIFSIPPTDAAIVALCATNGIDILLTWNQDHLLRTGALEKITRVNSGAGLPTPAIITPKDFLDRLMLVGKKLALSPRPVLPVYRVAPYLSRSSP